MLYYVLHYAKQFSALGELVAILILGAKGLVEERVEITEKRYLFGLIRRKQERKILVDKKAELAKIILVHKERLMKFMKHSARVPSSNKIVEKKFVRIGEGSMTYSIGHHRFIEMARAAGAVYKIGEAKGNTILINLEVFDEYMEQFREPPTEMKHPLPNVKGD